MINHYFDKTVSSQAGETAIIYRDRRISFFELFIYVEWIARYFQSIAVQPGQRVAILIPNSPEWVISFLGVMRVGGAAVPLDVTCTEDDLRTAIALAKPRAIITTPQYKSLLDAVLENSSQSGRLNSQLTVAVFEEDNIATLGGSLDSQALAVASNKNGKVSSPSQIQGEGYIKVRKPNGLAKENENGTILPESSALIQIDKEITTGLSEYSHADLIQKAESTIAEIQLTAADRLLCVAPLGYADSVSRCLIASILSGAALVMMDSHHVDEICKVLCEEHVTILAGQAPIFVRMSENHLADAPDGLSLRGYVCTGAPLPAEIGERLYQKMGIDIRQLTGETGAGVPQRN